MIQVTENRYSVGVAAGGSVSLSKPQFTVNTSESGGVTITRTTLSQVLTPETQTVTVNQPSIQVVTAGTQGAQGVSGLQTMSGTAGENLSALRIVRVDPTNGRLYYADKDSFTASVVGMTTTAANTGDPVTILTIGAHTDGAWSWNTSGESGLFLGDNGAIVQGDTGGAMSLQVGTIMSSSRAFIRIHQPIVR